MHKGPPCYFFAKNNRGTLMFSKKKFLEKFGGGELLPLPPWLRPWWTVYIFGRIDLAENIDLLARFCPYLFSTIFLRKWLQTFRFRLGVKETFSKHFFGN